MTDTQAKAPEGSNGSGTGVKAPAGGTGVANGAATGEKTRNGAAAAANGDGSRPTSAKSTTSQKTSSPGGHVDKENAPAGKSHGKKRRKVNHACIYCRRSHMTCDLERPCTRCVKRNIGHLCHDEPREAAKKSKTDLTTAATTTVTAIPAVGEDERLQQNDSAPGDRSLGLSLEPPGRIGSDRTLGQPPQYSGTAALVQPTPVAAPQASSLTDSSQTLLGFNDWNSGAQNQYLHDMHSFQPQYSFGTSEVSNEYNLLNDFLTNSMLEDGGMYSNEEQQNNFFQQNVSYTSTMQTLNNNLFVPNTQPNQNQAGQMGPPSQAAAGNAISRPPSGFPAIDKAREAFYLAAADPSGNEPPEIRMKKLMKAKFDAGLLKPFNYVKGYARLLEYMNRNLQPQSRTRIIRQLDRFRPKFRERMHSLTDIQLVYVEVAFERRLMEYDRVFASMAIPACCWRRTGEIYRGNNEMAKLLGVSIESLRDGKLAIHDVFAENSLVSYWEKFGHIAFDSSQKAILTSCVLRSKDPNAHDPEIRCCFSFTIRRDEHHVPFLIVGNFLPIKASER